MAKLGSKEAESWSNGEKERAWRNSAYLRETRVGNFMEKAAWLQGVAKREGDGLERRSAAAEKRLDALSNCLEEGPHVMADPTPHLGQWLVDFDQKSTSVNVSLFPVFPRGLKVCFGVGCGLFFWSFPPSSLVL